MISLSGLLKIETRESADPTKLVVLGGAQPYGLLVEEATALESLETIIAPDLRGDDAGPTPVLGTAMYRDKIVRVLDPNGIFRMARQGLEGLWNASNDSQLPTHVIEGV